MTDIELITVHDPADCEEAEAEIRRLREHIDATARWWHAQSHPYVSFETCPDWGCQTHRAALGSE